jgi:hypothetical protein
VVYAFGDASGSGFGGMTLAHDQVSFYSGQWDEEHSKQSSNHRELENLVIKLENDFAQGVLENTEVFIFTDSSTAEATYFKCTSKSQLLFNLILRLQFIHLHAGMTLHFAHIAGTRMIAQGTDGLLRSSGNGGVPLEDDFLSHIPLHLGVLERQPLEVREWVEGWFRGLEGAVWLTPDD